MKKRWIFLVLTVLFLWLIVSRFTELKQLKSTLAQGQWGWILAAALSQMLFYVIFTASYQSAFYTVDISTRTRDLIPVTLGSLFINVVVPAGGAGGAALFTEDLARRGKPAARAASGVLLQLIADFSAFTLLLIPGLIYLFIQHDLKIYEIVGAVKTRRDKATLRLVTIHSGMDFWTLQPLAFSGGRLGAEKCRRVQSSLCGGGRSPFAPDADGWRRFVGAPD
jgi:uncharacterized membrane protein YbhN (UPF0104 family)